MSLRDVYQAFGKDTEAGAVASRLLEQQHWFATLADFDPKTGEALPLALDEVLRRLNRRPATASIQDRLWRIVDHSRLSVEHLLDSLRESPRREQAILPIRAVRELNATSLVALNRRPGRNVREKLAGRPYMQAVRRYQSIDLLENRLLKAFVIRLSELLELRKLYLDDEDQLLVVIRSWLRDDDAASIGRWDNLPPNNTLLSHREYRRIWDAWRSLQSLDEDIDRDARQIDARAATVDEWDRHARDFQTGTVLYGDMPVLFDYASFSIKTWIPKMASRTVTSARRAEVARVGGAVCIDLTELPPVSSPPRNPARQLNEQYLWQRWARDRDQVDIGLYQADFPLLHPESTTVAAPDLFFGHDVDLGLADSAAHSFTRRLGATFDDASLTWLIPDHLNDFQVEILRRNLNARFPRAQPLPRSVAAVIAEVDYKQIRGDGFAVVALDASGGVTTATRLVARIDSELSKRLPQTRGFYWERTPTVVVSATAESFNPLAGVSHVAEDGQWWEATALTRSPGITEKDLRTRRDLGHFDRLITIKASPVEGGVRLRELQTAAGDLALWRDQIPELSIKVIKDGRYQPFYLVGKDTTIRPVRGAAVPIPVADRFTLPAGRSHYKFPLFQGSDTSDLGYEARIDSPSFPLDHDTACRLRMTYTYGVDEPYRLVFDALDGSFPSVQVRWRPKSNEPVTDAPGPEYPTPLTWQELQSHRDSTSGKQTDYLDWAARRIERLLPTLRSIGSVETATIKIPWKTNNNGRRFTFAERDYGEDVYIGEFAVAGKTTLGVGDEIYFLEVPTGSRTEARHVAKSRGAVYSDVAASIRRGLYVPFITTWSNGRSLGDVDCPVSFRQSLSWQLPALESSLLSSSTPQQIQREIRFLFCCMHRDMPASVVAHLVAGLDAKSIDERAYGFALGDLTQQWQRDMLQRLLTNHSYQTLSVLAQAIWRSSRVIDALDSDALIALASRIEVELTATNIVATPAKDEVTRITRLAELLLGLLMSRDSENQAVRGTLQPSQKLTRALAAAVDAAAATVARSSLPLRSRVQVGSLPEKPQGEHTPDLLYALRLYLTGDVGANAIRVTGVLDGDDD